MSARSVPLRLRVQVCAEGDPRERFGGTLGLRCHRIDPDTGRLLSVLLLVDRPDDDFILLASAFPGDLLWVVGKARVVDCPPILPPTVVFQNPDELAVIRRASLA